MGLRYTAVCVRFAILWLIIFGEPQVASSSVFCFVNKKKICFTSYHHHTMVWMMVMQQSTFKKNWRFFFLNVCSSQLVNIHVSKKQVIRWIIRKKQKFRFSRRNVQERDGKFFLKFGNNEKIVFSNYMQQSTRSFPFFHYSCFFFFTHNITCRATTY